MVIVGWVYFIAAPTVGRIKVGYTNEHATKRLCGMRTDCPVDLEPLGLLRGNRGVEGRIHSYLSECHWRGEWFEATSLLAEFIDEYARPWTAADEVTYPLVVAAEELADFVTEIHERVAAWFEGRGVPSVWDVTGRGKRVRLELGGSDSRAKPITDFTEAMRPMDLIREAFRAIRPEWRLPFLQFIQGEPVRPDLLAYLWDDPARSAAVVAVLAENGDRMHHFARVMTDAVTDVPYLGSLT